MRPRLNSLRTQLFTAIGVILLLSAVLTLGVGGLLTRQAVDRATLRDLSHQADLLAGREQTDILPLARLRDLEPYLRRQNEQVVVLSSLSSRTRFASEETLRELRARRAVDGSITIAGTSNYFSARVGPRARVGPKAFVLLRQHRNASADWLPFLNALAIAAAAGMPEWNAVSKHATAGTRGYTSVTASRASSDLGWWRGARSTSRRSSRSTAASIRTGPRYRRPPCTMRCPIASGGS